MSALRSILAPTDFSDASTVAFVHALRLALALKADLDIFHVEPHNDQSDWHWAPSVLKTLQQWNLLGPGATPADLERLGIKARRSVSAGVSADEAIMAELARSHADLLVMATHGRSGVSRFVQPSVTAPVAVRGNVPVLLLPANGLGFVDIATGAGNLDKVLIAVDSRPHPAPGFEAACRLLRALGSDTPSLATLHVGAQHPETDLLRPEPHWRVFKWTEDSSMVLDTIVRTAESWTADLVVAVTEGRRGFLDNLAGSTVDRLLARIKTPVLVVPADWE